MSVNMFKIVCMSRKTKEEKKIAAYRRKLKFLSQATTVEYPTETKISGKTSSEEIKESSENQQRKLFFIKDLKKSLLIICLIITLEIIIYFVRMNR